MTSQQLDQRRTGTRTLERVQCALLGANCLFETAELGKGGGSSVEIGGPRLFRSQQFHGALYCRERPGTVTCVVVGARNTPAGNSFVALAILF